MNFISLIEDPSFERYIDKNFLVFDYIETEPDYVFTISRFMMFICNFIDENAYTKSHHQYLIEKLLARKLITVMYHCFNKFCYQVFREEIIAKNRIEYNYKIHHYEMEENISEKLIEKYQYNSEEILDNIFFVLCRMLFYYFKKAFLLNIDEKLNQIYENLKKTSELVDIPAKNKTEIIIKKECFLFFEKIYRVVELNIKFTEFIEEDLLKMYKPFYEELLDDKYYQLIEISNGSMNDSNEKVLFIIHPDSLYLRPNDVIKFLDNAPYEDQSKKNDFVLEYYNDIIRDALEMRKILHDKKSKLLIWLFNIDYYRAEVTSGLFATIVNCILIYSLKLGNPMEPHDPTGSIAIINPYRYLVFQISLIHQFYLGFVISNYVGFGAYRLYNFEFAREHYTNLEKTKQIMSLFFSNEIYILLFSFCVGMLAMWDIRNNWLFSLQMFSVFNLFDTMKMVLIAIQMRYVQFMSTGSIIVIFILFYSSISYYFFRPEFFNGDLNENLCDSFMHCFLSMMNYSLRGGGVGFSLKTITEDGYWVENAFEWVFYFTIALICINIVNGIIVDTFQDLRGSTNDKNDISENVCYICSCTRSDIEVAGGNFHDHRTSEHQILYYFYYMFNITSTEVKNLNSLDAQISQAIEKIQSDFFPIH